MADGVIAWKDRKHHLWFPWSFTKYWIESGSLHIQKGLFSTVLDETLLYRVVDVTMCQSFAQKIFGTGTLILKVKIDATPELRLENIGAPLETRKKLSAMIEDARRANMVVGKEFYGSSSHHMDDSGDGDCDDMHDVY